MGIISAENIFHVSLALAYSLLSTNFIINSVTPLLDRALFLSLEVNSAFLLPYLIFVLCMWILFHLQELFLLECINSSDCKAKLIANVMKVTFTNLSCSTSLKKE